MRKTPYLLLTPLIQILLFSLSFTHAQTYNFKTYSVEDGLGQSQVRAIFQDSKGFLSMSAITSQSTLVVRNRERTEVFAQTAMYS